MLGRMFRTKIPSHTIDMYVRRMNIFASGHNHHQSLWYYLQPFIWSLRLAQIYLGESSPPALTTFKEDSCTRRSKWKHNFSNLTWWVTSGDLREVAFWKVLNILIWEESCWEFGALKGFSPCFEQLQDVLFKTVELRNYLWIKTAIL